MQNIDYAGLGEKIRQARQDLGLSQEKLSEKCNISTSFLGHIERGTRKMSLETLVSLSSVLDVSTDYLLLDSLPKTDQTILTVTTAAKKHGSEKYHRFLNAVVALSEGIEKL